MERYRNFEKGCQPRQSGCERFRSSGKLSDIIMKQIGQNGFRKQFEEAYDADRAANLMISSVFGWSGL
jgi:hypothetical protein